MVLNLARTEGALPGAEDFAIPFAVVAGMVALSAVQFASLSPEAGNEVAGRTAPSARAVG